MSTRRTTRFALVTMLAVSLSGLAPVSVAQRGEDNQNGPFNSRQGSGQESGSTGCTEYRLSAFGGDAGFRVMNRPGDFHRVSNGSVRGRVCDSGHIRVELSKRHPDTQVALEIAGREYTFDPGDRGDKLDNYWFRRYFSVDLPHHSGGYRTPYSGEQFAYIDDFHGGYGASIAADSYESWPGDHAYFDQSANAVSGPSQRPPHGALPYLHVDSDTHYRAHRRGIHHSHLSRDPAWH